MSEPPIDLTDAEILRMRTLVVDRLQYRSGRSREDAEDIAHAAMVRLLEERRPTEAGAWQGLFVSIADTLVYDDWRRRRAMKRDSRLTTYLDDLSPNLQLHGRIEDPYRYTLRRELKHQRRQVIHHRMRMLTDVERIVLYLAYGKCVSVADIAAAAGTTVPTVESYTKRALQRLRGADVPRRRSDTPPQALLKWEAVRDRLSHRETRARRGSRWADDHVRVDKAAYQRARRRAGQARKDVAA